MSVMTLMVEAPVMMMMTMMTMMMMMMVSMGVSMRKEGEDRWFG